MAQSLFIDFMNRHGSIGPAGFGKCDFRSCFFGLEKIANRFVFKVTQRFKLRKWMFDRKGVPEFLHAPKQECLVVRAFDEELQLRMLICDAECGRRSLPVIDFVAAAIDLFAQAFPPELLELESKLPKRLRIREQHQNFFASFTLKDELNKCCGQSGVFKEALPRLNHALPGSLH